MAAVVLLLGLMAPVWRRGLAARRAQRSVADPVFADRIEAIAKAHLDDNAFSVTIFADEMGVSERHLQRRVRALTGLTPAQFVRTARLRQAAHLLESDGGTIAEVAAAVGFSDPSYFARVFRRAFGVPPSRYPDKSDIRSA